MLFAIKWKLHANNPSLFSCSKITTWILWHSHYVFLRLKRKALRRRLSREKHARSRHIFTTLNLSTECCRAAEDERCKRNCQTHLYRACLHRKTTFLYWHMYIHVESKFLGEFCFDSHTNIFYDKFMEAFFYFCYFTWFVGFFQFFHIKTEVKIWNNEV